MVRGTIDAHGENPLTDDQVHEVAEHLRNFSEARIPTRYSGYSVDPNLTGSEAREFPRMQHTTSGDEGIFGESKSSEVRSAHNKLDRARKDHVANRMEEENDAGGSTQDVVDAGIRGSIEFTLNQFTGPVAASDVKPFSNARNFSDAEVREQMQFRENLKNLYERLGGRLAEGNDHSYERAWGNRAGDDWPSPARDIPSADATDTSDASAAADSDAALVLV